MEKNKIVTSSAWFESPYYSVLYRKRDNKEAQDFLDHLLRILQPAPRARILDLACGRGRHAVYLGKLHYEVTGVDASKGCIACAKVMEHSNLSFQEHDMREVFGPHDFDYVFNLFTSFGYFEEDADDLRVMDAVHQSLVAGGVFVLDFLNVEKTLKELVTVERQVIDEIQFEISRKAEKNFLVKEIRVKDKETELVFHERVKLLKKKDFERYFSESGFEIISLYGDYHFNPFDVMKSERMVWIVKKA